MNFANVTLGAVAITFAALQVLAAPQQSPVVSSGVGIGLGKDCTHDATVCGPGLLCLPKDGQIPGVGPGICRRPEQYDGCDAVATCDSSRAKYNLTCATTTLFSTGDVVPVFPGQMCQKALSHGEQCLISDAACLPGLVCGTTGQSSIPVCVTPTQMKLGQDCSKNDCAQGFLCQKRKDGSKVCVDPIAHGQPCNSNQFAKGVNPCADSFVCINGTCGTGLSAGSPCLYEEEPGVPSAQCDKGAGLTCLKSSTGALRCLSPVELGQPCGNSGGCFDSGRQCIRNYCSVPNGGEGDVCYSTADCNAGLKCVNSSIAGAGLRCHTIGAAGDGCGTSVGFITCAAGLTCRSDNSAPAICESGPVPIGEKCVVDQTWCASGLKCIPTGPFLIYPGDSGICAKVSSLGGSCNPSQHVVCDQGYYGDGFVNPAIACVNGKCAKASIGSWQDLCVTGNGVSCAPKDSVGKLVCSNGTFPLSAIPNLEACIHVNLSIGQQCLSPNGFDPNDICGTGLQCYGINDPYRDPNGQYVKTVCVQLAADGQACNYNQLIGCKNAKSSCVRGVCTSDS